MVKSQKPHPLGPKEPGKEAVYCANCKNFEGKIIGSKVGLCFGHEIPDSSWPMECPYYMNEIRILSIIIFLQSGISVYHKAIVQDLSRNFDPQLLSSFLQAINMFGEELAQEQISQIQFQKMNIFICRSNLAYGALIVKGDIDENMKLILSNFLLNVEKRFPDHFKEKSKGQLLPEKEVDDIGFSTMKEYFFKKMYRISPELIENCSNLKCAKSEIN